MHSGSLFCLGSQAMHSAPPANRKRLADAAMPLTTLRPTGAGVPDHDDDGRQRDRRLADAGRACEHHVQGHWRDRQPLLAPRGLNFQTLHQRRDLGLHGREPGHPREFIKRRGAGVRRGTRLEAETAKA